MNRLDEPQRVVSVRLELDKYEALQALAHSQYRSLSLELRRIIDQHLAEAKGKP